MDHASLEQVAGPVQIVCRDHRLTPYDALYVELAMRSGFPLATLDQPQRDAARALGVLFLALLMKSVGPPFFHLVQICQAESTPESARPHRKAQKPPLPKR